MCEIKQTTLSVSYIASETQQNTVSTWLLISYWVRYELYRRDWLWLWRTILTVDWTSSNWHCMVKIISSRLIFAGCLYSEVFFVIFGSNNSGISSAFIGDAIGETSACWTWTDWFVIWLFACTDWLLVLFVWACVWTPWLLVFWTSVPTLLFIIFFPWSKSHVSTILSTCFLVDWRFSEPIFPCNWSYCTFIFFILSSCFLTLAWYSAMTFFCWFDSFSNFCFVASRNFSKRTLSVLYWIDIFVVCSYWDIDSFRSSLSPSISSPKDSMRFDCSSFDCTFITVWTLDTYSSLSSLRVFFNSSVFERLKHTKYRIDHAVGMAINWRQFSRKS